MERIKTLVTIVLLAIFFVGFFILGLLINAIQLVLWLTLRPFNRWLYRKINAHLLSALWSRNI